ncbi:MAG: penicillin-binding transpeptidase domain-containing protein, partial [Alphaproteobacteria bacterium]|nr:penicillin-binding transpeptidase domain-containing protein [Alphaproteobacteria bacterium]
IKSVNAVSIRLCQAVGPKKVLDLAHRFGISNSMYPTLSLALGTMEMTLLDLVSAFSVFANQGKPVYGYGIQEIRDKKGRILYSHKPIRARAIVSEENLSHINGMLRRVVSEGTGRRINIDHTVMGKTGSNDNKDAYFIGYRGGPYNEDSIENGIFDVTFGVWVGNDNMAFMHRTSLGSNMPLKIAKAFLLGKIPEEDLKTKHGKAQHPISSKQKSVVDHTQNAPTLSELLD